ncbi:MAG: sorbosone dehydrogenase family protein [Gammaproteobacteria bacterium]|nr:sorbosone dehydrogenase family protein [Gammaproteobacteria bacterium]MYK46558.1 sorbosone dehydrogenase family protein [Gammaproteobacteria bacterium]
MRKDVCIAAIASTLAFPATAEGIAPGFSLAVYTDEVPNARQMAESESGVLFVGTRRAGRVYAVVPAPEGPPEVVTLAKGLTMPSGLALSGGDLYVAALDRVLRYPDIEATFRRSPKPEIVTDALPDRYHHGWKYLSVGPDGFLYVPVGAPCNICKSDDERFASILRMDPISGETTVYAHGVRNSVGMAWHPATNELWFTDNGRDMMGDDLPPEEVNRVRKAGAHYGYPYIHGSAIPDPEFGDGHDPSDYVPPEVEIQAHAAAIGMDFYTGGKFGSDYANALFIAEHGSWNRSSKVGYRVSVVRFVDEKPVYLPFVDVWLEGQRASGRPADVLAARDGSLLVSDDQGGRIYRVTRDSK